MNPVTLAAQRARGGFRAASSLSAGDPGQLSHS
jgi:hypothetical protein